MLAALLIGGVSGGCIASRHSGGAAGTSPVVAVPESAMASLAVCQIWTPRVGGSLTPIGDGLAVTAGHVIREETEIRIDGHPSRVRRIAGGGGIGAKDDDWAVLRVEVGRLRAPNQLDPSLPLRRGDAVYIAGFPGGVQTVYLGRVIGRPLWVSGSRDLVFIAIDGAPDLHGASGGPAAVWDPEAGWRVFGIYVGTWSPLGWRGYAVRRLPVDLGG